ncbi:MAG: ferredoxin [Spirochaetales bacterium]|nr:ferredoxin [Spirochaetales bacterium]MCF7938199.1 ferredoxin [Spirochaetales bacterium]
MKIRIDTERCTGCGFCEETLPQLFEIGEFTAHVKEIEITGDMLGEIIQAAAECPAEAISIIQDDD